ncbi:MAG TPA: UDP-N-acetylglucosamine 2-epimerase (non-hydrolyzing) [Clostridiales bacterium]|nr:UDP-N-acetylglucosamine 2-epimerase (non-hydrolyzing) [Clostridiales bacterium]
MRVCTIIGARPQFIKAAAVSARFAAEQGAEELLIHTGQHYDPEMSKVFFEELGIPREKYNLKIGSGPHAAQTGRMMIGIEEILLREKPDWVMIYGDTNSTLAGALAASKLNIPVAHVEGGMRSFNRAMPEEINRIVSDHLSELNFCSTGTAMHNLKNEGRGHSSVLSGDVMYDCALMFAGLAAQRGKSLQSFQIETKKYALVTCHRAENTDDPARLGGIINALNELSATLPVLWPMHPRTRKYIESLAMPLSSNLNIIPPVGYLDIIILERNARLILTDSGGIQKEAFFYDVPCVTMRDETEWVETVELGWNSIVGADSKRILASANAFISNPPVPSNAKPYGDGHAANKILKHLLTHNV